MIAKDLFDETTVNEVASFWKRLMALIYDALLIVAILLLAAVLATAFVALVFPGYQQQHPGALAKNPIYLLYLLGWWYAYYAVSWRRGGQTLGMRAWRLKLVNRLPGQLSHWQMLARFLAALCGVGLLMALLHPQKASAQDIVSNTAVESLPRAPKQP